MAEQSATQTCRSTVLRCPALAEWRSLSLTVNLLSTTRINGQEGKMRTRLLEALQLVASDRHKRVILLGGFDSGKTTLLRSLATEAGAVYVNLNLLLTDRLLSLPRSQYNDGVTVHRLIDELCDELSPDGQTLLVDNIELLFSPELGKINPVDTFKRISRQRPVVLALPARRHGSYADYSELGREDYMRIPLEDYVIIELEEGKWP